MRPRLGIADLRPPQRVHVVEGVGCDLGHAQRPLLRQVEAQLGRGLRTGGVLEDDPEPVDRHFLPGLRDDVRRWDQRHRPRGRELPETGTDTALLVPADQVPVHVRGPTRHHVAEEHVLRHRLLEEPDRGDDLHRACSEILLGYHGPNTAVVVDMTVRVDHRNHRQVLEVILHQLMCGLHRLHRKQRIHDDPTRVGPQETGDRQVVAAHLVDALGHLEQSRNGIQPGLPPQARVHRVGGIPLDEVPLVEIPHDAPTGVRDLATSRSDEAPHRVVVVRGVLERELVPYGSVRSRCGSGGRFRHPCLLRRSSMPHGRQPAKCTYY